MSDVNAMDGVDPNVTPGDALGDGQVPNPQEVEAEAGAEPQADIDEVSGMPWDDLASKQGWNPEYEGDNARTAQEFVEFGRDVIAPHIKSQTAELQTELKAAKADRDNMSRMMVTQKKVFDQTRERERVEIEERISQAVAANDLPAVNDLRKREHELYNAPDDETPQSSPDAQAWQVKNTWYGNPNNGPETAYAARIAERTLKENPHFNGDQIRSAVDSSMSQKFPELFPNAPTPPVTPAPTPRAPAVEGAAPRRVSRKKSGPTARNLPADAMAMAEQNVKDGLFKNVEEYAKLYFENDK